MILVIFSEGILVDHTHVFKINEEKNTVNNTFEWCVEGVEKGIESLQEISVSDISGLLHSYNEEGFFFTNAIHTLDQKTYNIIATQGMLSLLHCSIYNSGV